MSKLFSLKKEKPLSAFKEAVIIMQNNDKRTRNFFLDDNAVKALNLSPSSELGFIIADNHVLMADLTEVDKAQWNILPDEVNKIHKVPKYVNIDGEDYKFLGFTNTKLANLLEEEFELNPDTYQIFRLTLVNNFDEIISEEDTRVLEEMGIATLCLLEYKGVIHEQSLEEKSPKPSLDAQYYNSDKYTVTSLEDSLAAPHYSEIGRIRKVKINN